MSDPIHTVEIDRIILTGLQVPAERAAHLRTLVAVELQRLLEQEGLPDGLANRSEVSYMNVPSMQLAEPQNNSRLANGLAQSITQALRSVGQAD